jgi:hypothetical protein
MEGPPIKANNPEGFEEELKKVFASEKTKKIISSLLAQSLN